MMPRSRTEIIEIFLKLDELEQSDDLVVRSAARLGVKREDIAAVHVRKRSLDARKGRPLGWQLRVEVDIGSPREQEAPVRRAAPGSAAGRRIVIAGSGPAGTFCALWLAEAGAKVTVVERGKAVQPRRHDLAQLVRRGALDADSNYCFGEGGAGTFSDGKLYTRVKDREAVAEVLQILVDHGADADIRVDSRPHVGSNKLPIILQGLRARLEALGVEYRWSDPLVDVVVDASGRVGAARLRSGAELACDALVVATGHSAREIYEMLDARGVALEAKPFAVGARLEHPQPLIDRIQYGRDFGHPRLPAAFYHVTANVPAGGRERGVYSFCMCPGGWIVDSSTEPGRLATNGMSLKRRDSPYANAAMVVTVEPSDYASFARRPNDPLAGIAFQRHWEERAYAAGGGGFVAVAQRLDDFLARRATSVAGRSSYRPRVVGGNLEGTLPDFVLEALRRAVPVMDRSMRGFHTAEAQLVGIETRTSAPVRIVRDPVTLVSPTHPGLYPSAEGAGYAGGIVSAAIDGLKVARAIVG
jgi:uncharacterized FAD-dependent dehydrogenase